MPRLANSNPSSLLSQNYRSLAELEDQFVSLVCRHSMPKLSPALSDPTLKLDEVSKVVIDRSVSFCWC